MIARILGLLIALGASSAFAQRSAQLGYPVYLNDCGGYITLNQSYNGDLSVQLSGVNTARCYNLKVSDASSGRTIKSYRIEGTSYTLSKSMLSALGQDCRVNFDIGGGYWSNDRFSVVVPFCSPTPSYPTPYPTPYPSGRITYEWSNAGNCKKMVDGVYSGQNVSDYYCRNIPGGGNGGHHGRITYEWSNAGNCKKMIDGVYSGQNVSKFYCYAR